MKKIPMLFSILLTGFALFAISCSDGDDDAPASTVPTTFTQISSGGRHIYNARVENAHTCGIAEEGTLWCWGANGDGQLGTGDRVPRATPRQVGSDDTWTAVSAGGGFTCGINDGSLYCWGANRVYGKFDYDSVESDPVAFQGLLGLGDSYDDVDSVDTPTQVGSKTDWDQVSVGMNHACGIRDTGTARTLSCWGFASNSTDKLGLNNSPTVSQNEPAQVGFQTDWLSVSAGNRGTTWMTKGTGDAGTLWYFGEGTSAFSDSDFPIQAGTDDDWSQVASGAWNACGIRTAGDDSTLWCWGSNNHGEAGNNTAGSSVGAITQVGAFTNWESVDMSNGTACGVRNSKLYCWGRNYSYELGLGNDLSSFTSCGPDANTDDQWDCGSPELVNDDLAWTSVSTGNLSSCGIVSDGGLYCWGSNYWSQTGVEAPEGAVVLEPTKIN